MQEEQIIEKLNILKSAEPREDWIVATRKRVLSKAPVFVSSGFEHDTNLSLILKAKLNFERIFANQLAVSFSVLVFVVSGGFLAVNASNYSLPGDPLYSVKMASESMSLAVASEEERAKIEIEQAGKRLEELAIISQKSSDEQQHEKVEQLVTNFEKNITNANEYLTKASKSGEKEKVATMARVINDKSGKYTEALAKTSAILPEGIKEKVSEKVANAIDLAEEVNTNALMVLVEVEKSDEIKAKVREKIEKAQNNLEKSTGEKLLETNNVHLSSDASADANSSEREAINGTNAGNSNDEAAKELEKANENFENDNLLDALKNVVNAGQLTESVNIDLRILPVPVFGENKDVTEKADAGDSQNFSEKSGSEN